MTYNFVLPIGNISAQSMNPAQRLLHLVRNDVGTSLVWDYTRTDRRFLNSTGGANPATTGDLVGLDLDWSKHGVKTYAQVIADGGYAGPTAVPGNHAAQGTAGSRPAWQTGPKPHLLYNGVDDWLNFAGLIAGAAGTIVTAFRAGTDATGTQTVVAGGITTNDKRVRIQVDTSGRITFTHGTTDYAGGITAEGVDYRGVDVVAIQTWGNGRRRCYVSALSNPLLLDSAHTIRTDSFGNSYKVGCLETGAADFFKGRIYGTLIRAVETSDANIRNIVLPAFKALY